MEQEVNQVEELKRLAPADVFTETVTVTSYQREGERETANIHNHVIRQFTFHQFFKVIAHAERVFDAIKSYDVDLARLDDDPLALAQLIIHATAVAGTDIEALIALAIDRPVAYFETLDPDDGIKLAVAIVKVNKDFFVKRILPMIGSLKAEVGESLQTVGATP